MQSTSIFGSDEPDHFEHLQIDHSLSFELQIDIWYPRSKIRVLQWSPLLPSEPEDEPATRREYWGTC